jgi:hypothetical protein
MKTTILLGMACAVLSGGCTHYYYVANVQNVPLFREKDEFRISGSLGGGDESESIEVQMAYSLTDHIGIMANYMNAWGGEESEEDYAKGNYLDAGLGYYKTLGRFASFDIYGGLGHSRQHHVYSTYPGISDISFTNYFIQPSVGLTFDFMDVAFSSRLCRVHYFDMKNNDNYSDDELAALDNKNHYFLEPAITMRAGWKYVKAQFQASYVDYLNSPKLYIGEEYHFSLGLYFAIAGRYNSK